MKLLAILLSVAVLLVACKKEEPAKPENVLQSAIKTVDDTQKQASDAASDALKKADEAVDTSKDEAADAADTATK